MPRKRATAFSETMATGSVNVSVEDPGWEAIPGSPTSIAQRAAEAALSAARCSSDVELGVVLTGDATLRQLNSRYRGEDKATNVLSFALDDVDGPAEAKPLLGDVYVALETVRREATAQEKSVSDHLSHLVVHGVLHLLGYDHRFDADARRMESLETGVLHAMGIADPYGGDRRIEGNRREP